MRVRTLATGDLVVVLQRQRFQKDFTKDVRDLFGALVPTTSSIRIEASGPGVIGDVIFGDVFASRYAAAMPLQTRKFTRAVFSHVANALNFFTGIALYNPGSHPAEVTVEVFSDQGVMTGQTSFQLGRASRISKLLAELVPSTAGQAGGYFLSEALSRLLPSNCLEMQL